MNTYPAQAQSGRPLILCVDDNETQLRLLNDVLVREGFQVLQAATPKEAVEMMMEAPVSLVIADHFLRGLTGTELALKLKKIKPTVPILLHSGAQPETMKNVDAFLNKGEPIAEFLRVVRDLVRRFSS